MAEQKIRPLNIRRPEADLSSGDAAFNLAAQPILSRNGSPPSANQQALAQKTREHLTEEAARAMLATQASHLINKVDEYQLERIHESFEFQRAMLTKKRHREDQAHMDAIIHRRREFQIGAQESLLNAFNNSMIEICQRSLMPDETVEPEERPSTIVIQQQGFWSRLLGQQPTLTEITRK